MKKTLGLLVPVFVASLFLVSGCDDGGDDTMTDSAGSETGDTGSETAGPGPDATFTDDIYPNIISANCSCHIGGDSGGLSMPDAATAYTNLVSAPSSQSDLNRVEPGDPMNSYLIHKLRGTQADVGSGDQMPLGDMLSEEDIASVESWISGL